MRPLLRYLSCFFVLICAAYGIYTFVRPATSSAPPPVHRDTLIIRDTLHISRPVLVRDEVVRYVTVTLPSAPARPDSSNSNSSNLANIGKDSADVPPAADHFPDTAKMVTLPITQQVYRDSSYTAWVSGYAAALDSIHIHRPTHYLYNIHRPAPSRRWSFGLQGGIGLTPKGVQPYVGVGFSIRLYE